MSEFRGQKEELKTGKNRELGIKYN